MKVSDMNQNHTNSVRCVTIEVDQKMNTPKDDSSEDGSVEVTDLNRISIYKSPDRSRTTDNQPSTVLGSRLGYIFLEIKPIPYCSRQNVRLHHCGELDEICTMQDSNRQVLPPLPHLLLPLPGEV